jgi:acyl-CoA dehydrogenase
MTDTGATDPVLVETAERVLGSVCTHAALQDAETSGWAPAVWAAVADIGMPWIAVPEGVGGVGGTLGDALAVLHVAGRHAAPVPLAETSLLAGWLLAGAGLDVGHGPLAVVPGRRTDTLSLKGSRLSGTAGRVPWGQAVDRVVALVERDGSWLVVAVTPGAATTVEAHTNLAGEPRPTLSFHDAGVVALGPAPAGVDPEALRYRGALTRAALMAGALERMCEITVAYTGERRQFGRPVGRFQAVQQHLVTCAQQSAMVSMAAHVAGRQAAAGPARFEIAAAKLLADQAAGLATRAAHQAHGAMGMTQEYQLHHFSRRLWAWRDEYGNESYWSRRIGQAAVAAGADSLYPLVAGGSLVASM